MKLSWPQVVMYLGALAVVAVLALNHVDTTAIIGLIVALLLGGTLSAVNHVKDNTNGQLSGLVNLVREQSQQLARSNPVNAPMPEASTTEEETSHAV